MYQKSHNFKNTALKNIVLIFEDIFADLLTWFFVLLKR